MRQVSRQPRMLSLNPVPDEDESPVDPADPVADLPPLALHRTRAIVRAELKQPFFDRIDPSVERIIDRIEATTDYEAPEFGRTEDLDELGCRVPPLNEEIEIIRLLGAEVIAVTLNHENLDEEQLRSKQKKLREELSVPVIHPLWDGLSEIVELIRQRLTARA